MLDFGVYDIVIGLSILTVISYIFTVISQKTRIPTVLMLLVLGMTLREVSQHFGWYVEIPFDVIRFFGVIGLILILLEAGLDLKLSADKIPLIKRATASSLFVLLFSIIGIAAAFHFLLGQSIYISLVYAIPLSVISSTVVASSISYLSEKKREFLTYEAALSDIIGILIFDLLLAAEVFSLGLVAFNLFSIVVALVVSLLVSLGLIWLSTKAKVNVKAFLIFAVLLLLYAIGHKLQFPALLAVLVFGLVINNWKLVRRWLRARRMPSQLHERVVTPVADVVSSVTQESAFIIRTFFFTMFGYTVGFSDLIDPKVMAVGSVIVLIIFLVRYLYLRVFLSEHILPELFFAPRGLVTIVLFYSIPTSLAFDDVGTSIVFFVIMLSILIMFVGSVFFTPKSATREADEKQSWLGGRH